MAQKIVAQKIVAQKIVVRCRYSGHYVITDIEAGSPQAEQGGSLFCPYCNAEHVWSRVEPTATDGKPPHRSPLVRQAG